MKEKMSLFFKGMILGMACVIPGVSGGTLAVLLGIYEDMIEAASNFYKSLNSFKKYFMFLFPIGLGILVAIVFCAKIIKYGLEKAPIITILIFLGMILGGIPKLFKTAQKKPGFKECSFMLIGIIIVLVMLIIDKGSGSVSFKYMNTLSYILLFLVGMLASATMVIPGISGSFTLMLIGYYEPILNLINDITSLNNLGNNLLILLPFLLGILIGILIIAKIISYLLKRFHDETYYVIIGFVISSVISVFYQVFQYSFNVIHFIIGIILMLISCLFIYKIFEK